MNEKTGQSQADKFRSVLEECADILDRLEPYCRTIKDVSGMLRLALENDGQLTLLYQEMSKKR